HTMTVRNTIARSGRKMARASIRLQLLAGNGASARNAPRRMRSDGPALHHELLDLRDRLRGIEALGTGARAVHDGVAAVQAERVLERVEALARGLVARVHDPAVGLQQDRGAEVAVGVPPVA